MTCLRYPLYLSTTIAFENHLYAEHSQFKKAVSQSKESNIDTIGEYVAAWYLHQKLIMKSVLQAYGIIWSITTPLESSVREAFQVISIIKMV